MLKKVSLKKVPKKSWHIAVNERNVIIGKAFVQNNKEDRTKDEFPYTVQLFNPDDTIFNDWVDMVPDEDSETGELLRIIVL